MTGRVLAVAALALLALAGCASTATAHGTAVAPAPAGASASARGVATAPATPAPDYERAQRDAEAQAARFVTAATASCAAVGGVVVGDDLSGQLYCQSGRFTPSGRCGMWAGFDLDGTVNVRDRSYSPGCWTP